jgi:hypothetical protein
VFGPTWNKYITIDSENNSFVRELWDSLETLNTNYHHNNKIDKIFFIADDKLIWGTHNNDTEDDLYDNEGNYLEIPNIQNIKVHDWWLFFTSHDKKSWMMGWLTKAWESHTSFFKEEIEPMVPFISFDLKDLWLDDHEIQYMDFDTTKRYLLVHINKNQTKSILPIKI